MLKANANKTIFKVVVILFTKIISKLCLGISKQRLFP